MEGKLRVQHTVGSLLYYARAVNMMILHALNSTAADSSKTTERTMEQVNQLLGYMHTDSNTVIHNHASDMILSVHSDASYLAKCRTSLVRKGSCVTFELSLHLRSSKIVQMKGADAQN